MSNSKMISKNNLSKNFLLIAYFFINISGCYKVSFYHNTDKLREKPDGEIYNISSLYTFIQEEETSQIRTVCPSGASLVEIEKKTLDGLIGYFSLGFYSPQSLKVWCKRKER